MQSNLHRRSNAFWQHDPVASSMNKVMCECGAIYEPIKAKHLPAERIPFNPHCPDDALIIATLTPIQI
jgi:hypothetical protein